MSLLFLKYVVKLITTLKVLTSTNSIVIQLLRLCQIVVLGNLAWNWVDDCILMPVCPRLSDSAKNGHKALTLQKSDSLIGRGTMATATGPY